MRRLLSHYRAGILWLIFIVLATFQVDAKLLLSRGISSGVDKLPLSSIVSNKNSLPTTLIILGSSENNVYKNRLASELIPEFEAISQGHASSLLVFHRGSSISTTHEPEAFSFGFTDFYPSVDFSVNVSTVVLSLLGTNEMSLDHIESIYRFMKTDRALIVVEIGDKSIQTRSLLDKGALCWAEARLQIPSPNTAYLCNDLQISSLPSLQLDELRSVTDPLTVDWREKQPRPFWPCLFASAASAATRKSQSTKSVEEIIVDAKENEIKEPKDIKKNKKSKEVVADDNEDAKSEKPFKDMEVPERLDCKYRKSCYSTGKRAKVEDFNFDFEFHPVEWFWSLGKGSPQSTDEDMDGDGIPDSEDPDVDLSAQKLHCKFRKSCYNKLNVQEKKEDDNDEDRSSLFSGKLQVIKGEKKTLKDIAEKTVKKVKAAETKASARPLPASVIVEKKLNAIEEKMNEKLRCKFRKSCYESGVVPEIDEAWQVPSMFSVFSSQEKSDVGKVEEMNVNYEELKDLEKKVYCKYRKSCMETGIRPKIDPEIRINSYKDIASIPEMVEPRKQTLQEACKYRKSCYDTGIIPDLTPKEPKYDANREKIIVQPPTIVPSSVGQLKNLCKYRKSCYEEVASAESPAIVTKIRERQDEVKEQSKEKSVSDRTSNRLRGSREKQAEEYYRKPTKKERAAEKAEKQAPVKTEEVVEPEPEAVKEIVEPVKSSKKLKKSAEVKEEESPTIAEEASKPSKSKKSKSKEIIDEPIAEKIIVETQKNEPPSPEPKQEKKSSLKKSGKSKEVIDEETVLSAATAAAKAASEQEKNKESKKKQKTVVKEKKPDSEEKEGREKKLDCKYRRSCYETGERPVIEQASWSQSLTPSKSGNYAPDEPRTVDTSKSEADVKSACKFRKSCYESGVLPEIRADRYFAGQTSVKIEDEAGDQNSRWVKLGKCKYRRSCYAEHGIDDNAENIVKPEEKHKQTAEKIIVEPIAEEPKMQKTKPKSSDKKTKEEKEEKKEKKSKKSKEVKDAEDDHKEAEKKSEKKEKTEKRAPIAVPIDLSSYSDEQKKDCKWRKSCYSGVEPKATKEDHAGTMARQTREYSGVVSPNSMRSDGSCNVYYLSCRAKMGLPLKEKAPIGPNGRRLCRKKKPEEKAK